MNCSVIINGVSNSRQNMLTPKYQLQIEVKDSIGRVQLLFARPIEPILFYSLKEHFEGYNFSVTYGTKLPYGGIDDQKINVDYTPLYDFESVCKEIEFFLGKHSFTSFYYSRDIVGGKKEGKELASILD